MDVRIVATYAVLSALRMFGVGFFSPIYTKFLQSYGLTDQQINLVNLVYWVTNFFLEIPTGALADSTFGRKRCFVLSCFVSGTAMLCYSQAQTLRGFMVCEFLAAVGFCLASGSFQAWLVSELKYKGYNGSIKPVSRTVQVVNNLVTVPSGLIGAYLARSGYVMPWVWAAVTLFASGLLACVLMREHRVAGRGMSVRRRWRRFCAGTSYAYRYSVNHPSIQLVFIMGMVLAFAVQAPNMQWPFVFERLYGQDNFMKGVIHAITMPSLALGAVLGWLIERRVRDERSLLLGSLIVTGLGIALTVVLSVPLAATSAFMIHEVARGLFRPLNEGYLYHHIERKKTRATVASVASVPTHFGGAVGLVVSGAIATHATGARSLAWVVSGLVLVGVAITLSLKKVRDV